MKQVLLWVKTYSTELQVLSTVILTVVTYLYVRLTNKLVHTPYMACLIPSAELGYKPTIMLTNVGPGIATNVEIKAIVGILANERTVKLGPIKIEPNKNGSFGFSDILSDWPVYITWKTAIGKKQKIVLQCDNNENKIVIIGWWKRAFIWIKKSMNKYQSPFVKIYKCLFYNKRKKQAQSQ